MTPDGGNVGIGTTSPAVGLDVRPIARFWHGSTNNYTQFSNGNEINTFNSSGGNTVMYLQYRSGSLNVGAGTLYAQSGNGNVGIGTTSPGSKLTVAGRVDFQNDLRLRGTDSAANQGVARFYVDSSDKLHIDTSNDGNNLFVIDSSGNVGIGTTSPVAKLDVNGATRIGGKTTYTKGYGSLSTTGNAVAGLVSSFNGASAMFIFTCYGHTGSYQRIVYSCWNTSGTSWNVKKVIDEGDNQFDITVDAVGATRTFTFVSRSGTASYSPNVNVEHVGAAIDTSYL